ncbi:MAG TPA: chromate transporter [Xanthobacteraceae bacterium]|nr:chromate transporter [Xanthobacteraceae bacterium]
MKMSDSTAGALEQTSVPSLSEMFLGFLGISLSGFGGVMPWAQRVLVERKKWLTPEKFAEDVALAQFLPGPNIINLSIVVGSRFHGPFGSLVACSGLIGAPAALMMVLGTLYERYGDAAWLHGPLAGLSASAAGLVIAMAAKLATPLFRGQRFMAITIALISFIAIGFLRVPLWWVLFIFGPLSVAAFWWRLR